MVYSSLFIGLLFYSLFILLCAIYFWNTINKKGSLQKTQIAFDSTIFTELPPYKVFKIITAFAKQNGYKIDDSDEQQLALILNEGITVTGWGSLYSIYISEKIVGKTMIEIGIENKLGKTFLISPFNRKMINISLERMTNAIESALSMDYSVD